jgi:hypothetical protein
MGARSIVRALAARARTERDWVATRRGRSDVAVFHEFHAPPYGGGNQFLLALVRELRARPEPSPGASRTLVSISVLPWLD